MCVCVWKILLQPYRYIEPFSEKGNNLNWISISISISRHAHSILCILYPLYIETAAFAYLLQGGGSSSCDNNKLHTNFNLHARWSFQFPCRRKQLFEIYTEQKKGLIGMETGTGDGLEMLPTYIRLFRVKVAPEISSMRVFHRCAAWIRPWNMPKG